MKDLKKEIISVAKEMGVDKVGFTSRDRLDDAPPSADLGYLLPNAKSAISLAIAFDKAAIRRYLAKEDQKSLNKDHGSKYIRLGEAGITIKQLLEDEGYEAVAPLPNFKYREGMPSLAVVPPLSHRYVAVASGMGWIGWSGNLVTPEYGAAVAITSVVTSAELQPDPLVEGDSCRKCHLCAASCASHYISKKEEDQVKIAGRVHIHNKHATNMRCIVCCGGATGVGSPDAKWSTWSPHVLDLPGPGEDEAYEKAAHGYAKNLEDQELRELLNLLINLNFECHNWEEFNALAMTFDEALTCCNCMYICWPDLEDRKENYRLLTKSGRVIKGETGIKVVHT
jgi:epoxyqueuosine reductase